MSIELAKASDGGLVLIVGGIEGRSRRVAVAWDDQWFRWYFWPHEGSLGRSWTLMVTMFRGNVIVESWPWRQRGHR